MPGFDEPEMFDVLRAQGIDADDPLIRGAVRSVLASVEEIEEREGVHRARRCMEAIRAALNHRLQRPDITDLSSFEDDFHEEP